LTDALLGAGFSESDIQRIMGRNVERLLMQVLP
jgi:microsomal dipeptidase-like Zn-dependent dipeptidase